MIERVTLFQLSSSDVLGVHAARCGAFNLSPASSAATVRRSRPSLRVHGPTWLCAGFVWRRDLLGNTPPSAIHPVRHAAALCCNASLTARRAHIQRNYRYVALGGKSQIHTATLIRRDTDSYHPIGRRLSRQPGRRQCEMYLASRFRVRGNV